MKYIMWRNLIIIAAAAAGLSVAVAASADARGMGGREGAGVNVNMRGFDAQGRGPEVTPRGWSHGRKTGWSCRVGARGCVPPGLR